MTKLQDAIAAAVADRVIVSCAEVAELASEQLGYEPSLPSVSRTLANMGWVKGESHGKVAFTQTGRSSE